MPEVSVVIVCMNRPDLLFPCLDSLRAHTSVPFETLVVAYRFSADNLKELVTRYPWVEVIPSLEIRGFSENNNLALKHVKGRYCFILNDDTLLEMPVIDRLVADMEALPASAAALSPCIRFADGRIQTCGRAPWTARRYARHYLHLVDEGKEASWGDSVRLAHSGPSHRFRHPLRELVSGGSCPQPLSVGGQAPQDPSSSHSGMFQTYTLNGACFLIKTEVFREAGWFDERFFFTPEDIALGHKLNDMGYTVWADPSVSIIHLAGGSVSAMEPAIKPARVRGSLIFYGEPLWLRCFIGCFEALRVVKYAFLPATEHNQLMARTARNVLRTVFSKASPKELFIRFSQS